MATWTVLRTEQASIPTDCGDLYYVKVYVSESLAVGAQHSNIDLPSSVFSGFTVSFYGSSNLLTRFNAKRVKTELSDSRFYIRYYDDAGILKATEDESVAYIQNNYAALLWAMLIDPNGNAIPLPGYMFRSSSSVQRLTSNTATQLGTMRVNRSWYISGTYVVTQTDLDKAKSILLSGLPEDPYGYNENQTPPGGYAGFDYTGDDVDIPALPTISAAASGFVRLYNPTIGEVQGLANYLWSGAFDLATYKKLFGNPMDCFLSFGIIPVTPPRSANKEAISFANMPDPGVTAYKLTSQFAEFDCGSVTIDGSKYTSSAMDYSPYTKAELFLPFCGTHSLAVDDIMDSTISIKYHMDLYTGACVAYVKITRTNSDGSTLDSVLYQFTGNILATIPLTGADHSNFRQSMLFMGAAVAATVATAGGAAPEIGGAMAVGDSVSTSALGGAAISASGINAVMSMKPNVIRSGNLSANAGFLGLKKPVITLTCPNLCRPDDENKLAGMPCQKSGTLTDFNGFNIVGACHLDNIPCTMEELRMIDAALAKGVIV